MEGSAQDSYLVTEVMTATPQKLQLMLVDGAIRFTGKAQRLWEEQKDEEASEAIIRAQEILGEMLAALDRESESKLVRRVAAVYLFVFRELMEASLHRDARKLAGARRVLEVERETWQAVCEKFGSRNQLGAAAAAPIAPIDLAADACGPTDAAAGGFSIDA